jgi:hypothetical protein
MALPQQPSIIGAERMLWGDPDKYPITEEGLRDLYRDHPEADPLRGLTREAVLEAHRTVAAYLKSTPEGQRR